MIFAPLRWQPLRNLTFRAVFVITTWSFRELICRNAEDYLASFLLCSPCWERFGCRIYMLRQISKRLSKFVGLFNWRNSGVPMSVDASMTPSEPILHYRRLSQPPSLKFPMGDLALLLTLSALTE